MTQNQEFMLVLGPLCRYAEDLELVFNVLSAPNRSCLIEAPIDLASFNFFFIDQMNGYFVSNVSPDVKEAQVRVIEFIEQKYSKKVRRYRPHYLNNSFLMWLSMASEGVDKNQVSKLMSDSDKPKNPWLEVLKALFLQSTHTCPTLALSLLEKLPISETDQRKYLDFIKKAREELNILLRQSGILIFPGFPSEAPYHNQALWTNPVDWIAYYGIFNALGLPSTQVCLGLGKNGLPIGIQLITNMNCDYSSIKLAVEIEKALGGWCQP
jgi:fatty acid amide hydrolase 2